MCIMLLGNLKELKNDMIIKDWTICSFIFKYKGTEYIVLVKRFVGTEKRKNQYALVKLQFMKSDDLGDDMQVEANSNGLIIETQKLREYFGIEYADNLGNILKQFTERLGNAIPKTIPTGISEDPNKIYCNKVKRNPNGGQRSEFNADKTKLLRASLFEYFRNDSSISFCFYADPKMENDDTTILRNFSK